MAYKILDLSTGEYFKGFKESENSGMLVGTTLTLFSTTCTGSQNTAFGYNAGFSAGAKQEVSTKDMLYETKDMLYETKAKAELAIYKHIDDIVSTNLYWERVAYPKQEPTPVPFREMFDIVDMNPEVEDSELAEDVESV